VLPVAVAPHVTSVLCARGSLNVQSLRADRQRTDATESPTGSNGFTCSWVARPGTAGLFTSSWAPSDGMAPNCPPDVPSPPPMRNLESATFQCPASQLPLGGLVEK